MKRLPISYEDAREHVVRFEFRNGDEYRVIVVDRRVAEELGPKGLAREFGLELPTGRKDVREGKSGRKIGPVPAAFDPMFIKSTVTNFLYKPRPHDWTDKGDYWEAHYMLGPGDLDAVPGFVWDRSEWAEPESHNAAPVQHQTATLAENDDETGA